MPQRVGSMKNRLLAANGRSLGHGVDVVRQNDIGLGQGAEELLFVSIGLPRCPAPL